MLDKRLLVAVVGASISIASVVVSHFEGLETNAYKLQKRKGPLGPFLLIS